MQTLLFSSVVLGTYYLMCIVQAVLHRSFGHRNRIRAVFRGHVIGHHGQYPASRLRSEKFVSFEKRAVDYYVIPAVVIVFVVYLVFGPLVTIAHAFGVVATFAWHVYLHRHYHLTKTPFERFAWFRKKRELHFEHHRNARVNFAVVEFWVDNLMGTRGVAN